MLPIKSCPFCGDRASIHTFTPHDHRVMCDGSLDEECAGRDNDARSGYLTEEFAAEAWNKRI